MKVKINRREYDITEKDYCIFNGACYILMSRKVFTGWSSSSPTFPKTLMNKMLKEGTAYKTEERYKSSLFQFTKETFPVYRFREVENNEKKI